MSIEMVDEFDDDEYEEDWDLDWDWEHRDCLILTLARFKIVTDQFYLNH